MSLNFMICTLCHGYNVAMNRTINLLGAGITSFTVKELPATFRALLVMSVQFTSLDNGEYIMAINVIDSDGKLVKKPTKLKLSISEGFMDHELKHIQIPIEAEIKSEEPHRIDITVNDEIAKTLPIKARLKKNN